ncbi:YEATS domain-containing protein 2 [Chytriomyces hyalinus]|nr:YEATS domain-containing protein 2 [Chytriomyces hyalinus]
MADQNERLRHAIRTHFELEILLRQKERSAILRQIELNNQLKQKVIAFSAALLAKQAQATQKRSDSIPPAEVSTPEPAKEAEMICGADGKPVRLVCPVPLCTRTQFASAHGFLSHCRNSHHVRFSSKAEAIAKCGVPLDEDATSADKPKESNLPVAVVPAPPETIEDTPENLEGALLAHREDGVLVKLSVSGIERSGNTGYFVSVHGFISHCRNAHRRKFPSFMVAIRLCGIPVVSASEKNLGGNKPESAVPLAFDLPSTVVRESDIKQSTQNLTSSNMQVTGIKSHDEEAELDVLDEKATTGQSKIRVKCLDEVMVHAIKNEQVAAGFEVDESMMDVDVPDSDLRTESRTEPAVATRDLSAPNEDSLPSLPNHNDTRFLIKKRVVVGNVSRYIPEEKRKLSKFEFKWMIYVRGPPGNADITPFITQVRFHLHPDYAPNEIIDVFAPPFTLTRYGWGEFSVRVRLYFVDPNRNKPQDVIYTLKFDKFMSGRQVLGGEQRYDVELDRATELRESEDNKAVVSGPGTAGWVSGSVLEGKDVKGLFGRGRHSKGQMNKGLIAIRKNKEERLKRGKEAGEFGMDVKMEDIQEETQDMDVERSASPQNEMDEDRVDSEQIISSLLEARVPQFPLYSDDPANNPASYSIMSQASFQALSVEGQFQVESARAAALLNSIQSDSSIDKIDASKLTVEKVIQWCRSRGHSVYPQSLPEAETTNQKTHQLPVIIRSNPYCRYCGFAHTPSKGSGEDCDDRVTEYCTHHIKPSVQGQVGQSSLSSATRLFESARLQMASSSNQSSDKVQQPRELFSFSKQSRATANDLVFVWSTVAAIGLPIPDSDPAVKGSVQDGSDDGEEESVKDVSSREVVGGLLFEAMRVFVSRLVKQSGNVLKESISDMNPPINLAQPNEADKEAIRPLILPVHVRAAIQRVSEFDFLTSKYCATE